SRTSRSRGPIGSNSSCETSRTTTTTGLAETSPNEIAGALECDSPGRQLWTQEEGGRSGMSAGSEESAPPDIRESARPRSVSRSDVRDGLLVLDKPEGPTSHDVVFALRRLLGGARTGHAGTLDPFASGVLVVAVGRATRLLRFLAGADKVYEGTIR